MKILLILLMIIPTKTKSDEFDFITPFSWTPKEEVFEPEIIVINNLYITCRICGAEVYPDPYAKIDESNLDDDQEEYW